MNWDEFLDEKLFDAFFEWIVPLIGVLLLVGLAALVRSQIHDPWLSVLTFLLPAFFVTLIVYQALVMHNTDLESGQRQTVASWYAIGIYTMIGLGGWTLMLSTLGGEAVPQGVEALTEIVAGGLFGLLVGVAQLRAEQNAEEATQAKLEQEFLERQQETNEMLNRILRHHLLNGLAVIRGQAQILEEQTDGDPDEQLETIVEESREMADTIEDIRRITRTLTEEPELEPVDLDAVLERQFAAFRSTYPSVEFRRNGSATGTTVAADDLLGRAVGNVLENAAVHNTTDEPVVELAVEETAEAALVTVSDNGPGVPDERKDEILEASTRGVDSEGEGLGLFLTASIVEQYGGTVSIDDRTPSGTTVELSLPKA